MTSRSTATTATRSAELRCEELVVGYPRRAEPVLRGISIRVPTRQVTTVLGPNGSGKSTLLKSLAGQLAPSAGHVYLDGQEMVRERPGDIARKLGVLFQENSAPANLTVEALVRYGRFPHLRFLEAQGERDRRAIERALRLTGTEPIRATELERLSSGQRQLVWIAMALAQETRILLLDEPTTFLDMRHQLQVMNVVRNLCDEHGITIVAVMHDVNLAARYSDHVMLLRDGAVIAEGEPSDVITTERMRRAFDIEGRVIDGSGSPLFVAESPVGDSPRT